MAVRNGEKIFNDVRDGVRDISTLSRDEVLAAKTYIATRKQKTFATQQPLQATKQGQAQLEKVASLPRPKEITPTPEPTPTAKTFGTQLEEALTRQFPKAYPAAKEAVGAAYEANPFLKATLGGLGAPNVSAVDIAAEKVSPSGTKTIGEKLSEQYGNFSTGVAQSIKQQLGTGSMFPNVLEALSAGFGTMEQKARPSIDVTKGIYERAAISQGMSPEQAKKEADAWVARNPNLAGTSANILGATLDPLNLPITGAVSKVGKGIKLLGKGAKQVPTPKVEVPTPAQPSPSRTLQRRYPGVLTPRKVEPNQPTPTDATPAQQVPTTQLPEPEPTVTPNIPEPQQVPVKQTPTPSTKPISTTTTATTTLEPKPSAPTTVFILPKDLVKSNPRYGYGDKKFEVEFESDLDKALYIIAGTTKSKAHDKFIDALIKYTGLSEPELKVLGQQVRQVIKNQAKGSPAGKLRIADTGVFSKQAPTVTSPPATLATPTVPAPTTVVPTPAPQPVSPQPKSTQEVFTLPTELKGSKPRYGYSGKNFTLTFESDLDKALYIVSQKTPSKADAKFIQALMNYTGLSEDELRKMGLQVREQIKAIAKNAQDGDLKIPDSGVYKSQPVKPSTPAPQVKPTPATVTKPTPTDATPAPKDPTVITTQNVSPEIAQIAQQWKRMMNIAEDVLIVDPKDIENIPSEYRGFKPFLRLKADDEYTNGAYLFDNEGMHVIILKPQKSIARTLELLSHEMGHMLMNTTYLDAPKSVRDAIDAEYDAWYQKNKAPTNLMSELGKNLRAYKAGQAYRDKNDPISTLTQYQKDYFLGKDEWFADQVARWATTTEKPLTVVEKFFARLAKVMKQFFQVNKEYLPTKTMKDWLDGLEKSAKNNTRTVVQPDKTVGETIIRDFADQFSGNKSKDPKVEAVLTAVKPIEAFKQKASKIVQEVKDRTLAIFKAYSKLSESQRDKFFKGEIKIADASNEAVRDVDNITKPLKNAEEFDAFRRIVILRDLYQTAIKRPSPARQAEINSQIDALEKELNELTSSTSIWKGVLSERIKRKLYMLNGELNPILPKGLTVKQIVDELRRLEADHLGNPSIRKALDNYKTLMKKVFDDLVRRGKISAERERTDYYPHDVFNSAYALDFADPSGTGKKFESPYRFYTQQRVGSEEFINANFEEVITNTLTKVYMDNAIDDLAEAVIPEVDILRNIKPSDVKNPNQSKNVRRAQTVSKMRVVSGREQAVRRSAMVDLSEKIVDIDGKRYRFYSYGDKIHLIPENLYEELKTFREPQDNLFLVPFQKATGIFKGTAIAVSGAAHQTMNLLSGITNLAVIDPKALLNAGRAAKILLGSNDKELQQGVAKIILGQPNPQGVKASDIEENIRVFAIDNGIIEPLQRSSNVHRFSPTWRKIASWMNVLRLTRNVSQINDEFLRMMKLIADYDRALEGKPPKTAGIINTKGLDIEQQISRTAHEFFINPKRQSKAMRSFASQLMFPFINWAANSSIQTARYIKHNPKKSAVAFLAFPALLETWNNTEERAKIEELLPEDKRKIPHFITDSVDENGKPIVLYFNFLPGLSFFDLTNLDYIPQNVSDVLLGRKTGMEALETTGKKAISVPTDIIENFANPIFKTPAELYFNRSLYTGKDIVPPSQKGTSQGLATGLEYALKSTVPPARAYSTAQTKIESAEVGEKASIGQVLGDALMGVINPVRQVYKPEDRKKLEEGALYRKIEKGTISANRQKQDILKPALIDFLATGNVDAYRKEVQKTNLRGSQIKAYRDANLEELLSEAIQKTKDKNKKEQLLKRLELIRKKEERELSRRAKRANE